MADQVSIRITSPDELRILNLIRQTTREEARAAAERRARDRADPSRRNQRTASRFASAARRKRGSARRRSHREKGDAQAAAENILTRDDFTGRFGRIGQAVGARASGKIGNLQLIGRSVLAFMAVETMALRMLDYVKGTRTGREIISESLRLILPNALVETLPAILDEHSRKERVRLMNILEEQRQLHNMRQRFNQEPALVRKASRDASRAHERHYQQQREHERSLAREQEREVR